MSETTAAVPSPEESRAGFRVLMRNRNYALLWSGQLVSEMGNRFHWIAVSLWIFALTKSASAVSFAVAAMFAGSLFSSIWAGAVADRFNRRTILVGTDILRATLVALIPFLMEMSLWLVYVDLILVSVASGFFRPAMFSIVPQLVSRRQLLPANSFFSAMDTGTEIIGPALAGLMAFRIGYAPLLYLDALSYGLSALCIMGVRFSGADVARGVKSHIWGEIVEGVKYIGRDSLQRALFVLIIPAYLVGSGLNALQTPLAKGVVGISDREFGIFNSVWGAGFLIASLLLGWYGRLVSRGLLILGGFLAQFAFTWMMGLSTSYAQLLITGFGVGFMNTLSFVGLSTLLMEYTPSSLMGRVISTRQFALHLIRVSSPLAFGSFADRAGVPIAISLMTFVGAAGTLAVSVRLIPLLRSLDSGITALPEVGPPGRHFLGGLDASLEYGPQIRLNFAAIAIVSLTWLFLAFTHTPEALWVVLSVAIVVYVGRIARRKGWLP